MTNRLATDAAQAIVWRWEGEAFGNTPAQELAGVSVNLRFPGQYFDQETALRGGFYPEREATGVRLDDAEAALRGLVVFHQRREGWGDERLPQPALGLLR